MTDEWNYPYEGHRVGSRPIGNRNFPEVVQAQAEALVRYSDGDPYAICAFALREAAAVADNPEEAQAFLDAAIYLETRGDR